MDLLKILLILPFFYCCSDFCFLILETMGDQVMGKVGWFLAMCGCLALAYGCAYGGYQVWTTWNWSSPLTLKLGGRCMALIAGTGIASLYGAGYSGGKLTGII